jgi:hypothetical protein
MAGKLQLLREQLPLYFSRNIFGVWIFTVKQRDQLAGPQ